MAPITIRVEPQALADAYERSKSLNNLAKLLGIRHGETAKRVAVDAGYAIPAPHWQRNVTPPPAEDEPPTRVAEDTALSRVNSELASVRKLYAEAVAQIAALQDVAQSVADRCVTPRPAPAFTRKPRKAGKQPERTAILLLSDWQLGELVHDVETGGVNAYSWAVAEKRCARLVDACIGNLENQMRAYRIERLVVAILGDIVEGHDIFNGQPWSLEKDAAMQAVDGADLMASVLTAIVEPFLPEGIVVDVYAVPGNHGKPGGRKAGQTPVTFSFDLLLYEMLRRQLTNWPLREFAVEPAGRLLFTAADQVCLMTHGNEVRGWGGFPFYGLDKTHARLTMELETLFAFWLLGHWHSTATLPAGRGMRIVNGTMVGANQLTQAAVLTTSAPSQTMLYMSREYGLAEVAYLVLEPERRREPTIHGAGA